MNILKFLESSLKSSAKWVLFENELQAHETEILRKICRAQKREFNQQKIKDEITADLEAAFTSLDFFSSAKLFYLHLQTPSKFDTHSERRWERIMELSDPQGNWLFVSAEDTKKLAKTAPLIVDNSFGATTPEDWLRFFNQSLEAKLDNKRIEFMLAQAPESYLDFMHWVELWKLGGDEWAEHALGWGERSPKRAIRPGSNPAYDWVDAALAGRKDIFLSLTDELISERGEDPLRLWGLLGKSIKISAQLGMGENVVGEPPFMINKLRRVKYRPELLDWWCKCDLAMKGSRADVLGLLSQLP